MLLQRVARRLESLWINGALREHLEVIRDMPALRYLYVLLKNFIAASLGVVENAYFLKLQK